MLWANPHGANHQVIQLLEEIPEKKCEEVRTHQEDPIKIQWNIPSLPLPHKASLLKPDN